MENKINNRLVEANKKLVNWFTMLSSQDKRDIMFGLPVSAPTLYAYFGGRGTSTMTAEWILGYMEKNYQHKLLEPVKK